MRSRVALATAVAGILSGALTPAAQAGNVRAMDVAQAGIGRAQGDGAADARTRGARSSFSPQAAEGPSDPRNLPSAQENVELVGKWDVPGVFDGQIADVAVHKGWAYLNSWDDPECRRGGVYVVDIRDPANPKPGPFIPALQPYYHGEGAQALSISTPQFTGDLLAVNNETYSGACGGPTKVGGGFDLYDVSDPENPAPLVQAAGDRAPDGALEPQDPAARPNSYHSVFVWQDGPRAYLVGVDNTEFADVDVFDITDPRAPEQIGDYDLVQLFPQIVQGSAEGDQIFSHDIVVKRIGDRVVMKADYWDAGYVQLDVTDPRAPTLITDTDFDRPDPLTSFARPEGNAHQGEFSADNQFLLAADEDFTPFRTAVTASTGPRPGIKVTAAEGDAAPIAGLPDASLNGPSVFVGDACEPTSVPDAPADDANPATDDIALIERGGLLPDGTTVCGFADKLDNAAAAGWDGVVVFNQVRPDDTLLSMVTGEAAIPGVLIRRASALGSGGVLSASETTPAIGTAGPVLGAGEQFDGWGYAHLYDARTSEELDAYAIEEALDPRYATQFGDLSIHEFATDPQTNLAYSAYYAGGIRVFQFSREAGLVETGKWIEEGGSNYWGVEQLSDSAGGRLIAGSDRDRGLRILRYTGPGAVLPATPAPAPQQVPVPVPVPVPVAPPEARILPDNRVGLRVGRFSARTRRVTVTADVKGPGVLSGELRIRTGGKTVRLARTVRRPTRAGSYRLTLQVTRSGRSALRAALRRSDGRAIRGTVRVAYQPRGGQYRIVTRSLGGLR